MPHPHGRSHRQQPPDQRRSSGVAMIRLLVIAEVRLYRDGLAEALGRRAEVSVVGLTGEWVDGVQLAADRSPDVVLLDVGVPDVGAVTRALLTHAPAAKVVGLGVAECEESVIACIEAGMTSYVPCEASIDDLVAVVESVVSGRLLCPANIVAALARRLSMLSTASNQTNHAKLTARELEVADQLDKGMSNKEIAALLHIEVPTVKNHIHRILEKLRAHSRGEAAARLRADVPAPGPREHWPDARTRSIDSALRRISSIDSDLR